MKVLLLNGSPRQGNTVAALDALKRGLKNIKAVQITRVDANEVSVAPCIACNACQSGGKCVFDDDTNDIVDEAVASDVIVFATPVYWWGITAQLKVIIDKFYSQGEKLHELRKKIGIIVIGEADQSDKQYEIIPAQFKCICDYLGWDIKFCQTYTAAGSNDLAENPQAMAELENLWEKL